VRLGRERPELGRRVLRIAEPQRLGRDDEPGQELVEHRPLDVEP
jgi:hypothetical protein